MTYTKKLSYYPHQHPAFQKLSSIKLGVTEVKEGSLLGLKHGRFLQPFAHTSCCHFLPVVEVMFLPKCCSVVWHRKVPAVDKAETTNL